MYSNNAVLCSQCSIAPGSTRPSVRVQPSRAPDPYCVRAWIVTASRHIARHYGATEWGPGQISNSDDIFANLKSRVKVTTPIHNEREFSIQIIYFYFLAAQFQPFFPFFPQTSPNPLFRVFLCFLLSFHSPTSSPLFLSTSLCK